MKGAVIRGLRLASASREIQASGVSETIAKVSGETETVVARRMSMGFIIKIYQ